VRIGLELAAAWVLVALSAATGLWRRVPRPTRAGLGALVAWLAVGTVLFSAQQGLRPRYLEALDPAVAGCLGGLAVVWAGAARRRATRWALAAGCAAVGAAALVTSAAAIGAHVQDSGTPGALPPARLAALSRYLRAHQAGARYEGAWVPTAEAGGIIARDGRPVLLLDAAGHRLVGVSGLRRAVAAGQVRNVVLGSGCARSAWCRPLAAWTRAHGSDVSRAAGQPRAAQVYAVSPAARSRTS
jgi:hypothetical protein